MASAGKPSAAGERGRARYERFTGHLPVRVGDENIGEIDFDRIFARGT